MASRSVTDLSREMHLLATRFILECLAKGIPILIYCTYRSAKEQNKMYRQGRKDPGPVVTYKKGGESKHNHELNGIPDSLAFDFVPFIGGKCQWNDDALYEKCGVIGESIGLKWGGRWKMKDDCHMEV